MSWQEKAACKDVEDPEIFFPTKENLARGNEAIVMCFSCPVRPECKDYRKRTGSKYGIWAAELTKRGEDI